MIIRNILLSILTALIIIMLALCAFQIFVISVMNEVSLLP